MAARSSSSSRLPWEADSESSVCQVCRRSRSARSLRFETRIERRNEDADELVRRNEDLDMKAVDREKLGDALSVGVGGVPEVSNEEAVLLAIEDCDEDLLGTTKPLVVC